MAIKKRTVKKRHGAAKRGTGEKRFWIQGAIKRPGALRRSLKVKAGKNIPAGKLSKAAKKGGKLGKRARLAQTLRGFH